jgi:hypothetical protein
MEDTATASLTLVVPAARRRIINFGAAGLVVGLITVNAAMLADNMRGAVLDPLSFEQRELVPLFEVSSGYSLTIYEGSTSGPVFTITQEYSVPTVAGSSGLEIGGVRQWLPVSVTLP